MTLLSHTVDRKGHRFRRIVYPLGWEGGGERHNVLPPGSGTQKKSQLIFCFLYIYLL